MSVYTLSEFMKIYEYEDTCLDLSKNTVDKHKGLVYNIIKLIINLIL